MPKEPTVQGRSLNQAAIDAIAARIDSYDQAWDRRMLELTESIKEMQSTAQQVAKNVEAITEFLGTAAEEQKATQIRLERLEEKVDRRFDALTDTLQGFQSLAAQQAQTTDRLVQLLTMKAA